MIYNHRVKRNGIYYETGQDVPMDVMPKEKAEHEELIDRTEGNTENLDEVNVPKRGRPKKTE